MLSWIGLVLFWKSEGQNGLFLVGLLNLLLLSSRLLVCFFVFCMVSQVLVLVVLGLIVCILLFCWLFSLLVSWLAIVGHPRAIDEKTQSKRNKILLTQINRLLTLKEQTRI